MKCTFFRVRAAKTAGLCRKTLEKVLQSRKNRFLSQSDGFGCKPFGFSYFLKIESFSKYFVDVLKALLNREIQFFRARTAKTTSFCRKTLEKMLQNRKN